VWYIQRRFKFESKREKKKHWFFWNEKKSEDSSILENFKKMLTIEEFEPENLHIPSREELRGDTDIAKKI